MRPLLGLVWVMIVACGTEPPLVALEVTQSAGTAPIPGLERLRLTVQSCDQKDPVVAQNVPLRGATLGTLEANLAPGVSFYVWLQGWLECVGECKPPEMAVLGDCVCVQDGTTAPSQRLALEACTDWTSTETPITLPLMLAMPADLCPPAPKAGCQ